MWFIIVVFQILPPSNPGADLTDPSTALAYHTSCFHAGVHSSRILELVKLEVVFYCRCDPCCHMCYSMVFNVHDLLVPRSSVTSSSLYLHHLDTRFPNSV